MADKKEKKYVSDNAQLMAEWNWEKNDELELDPKILTLGSGKKHGGNVARDTSGKQQLQAEIEVADALFAEKTKSKRPDEMFRFIKVMKP